MKWQVTIEIDDPKNLIQSAEDAGIVAYDLISVDNCTFKVTDAILVLEHPELLMTQRHVLHTLKEQGRWYLDCGWNWTTSYYTEKVLDSLVRLELVKLENGVYTPA